MNIPFGSGIISNSTGILLNDEMDDFAQPNKSSSVTPHAAEANFIAPGRRPLSAMSPMFAVERSSGRLVAAAGASGGPLIVSATLQTLARWVAAAEGPVVLAVGVDQLVVQTRSGAVVSCVQRVQAGVLRHSIVVGACLHSTP